MTFIYRSTFSCESDPNFASDSCRW